MNRIGYVGTEETVSRWKHLGLLHWVPGLWWLSWCLKGSSHTKPCQHWPFHLSSCGQSCASISPERWVWKECLLCAHSCCKVWQIPAFSGMATRALIWSFLLHWPRSALASAHWTGLQCAQPAWMAAMCKLRGAGMVLDYGHLLDPRNAHGTHLLPDLRMGYSKIAVVIIPGFFCMVFLGLTRLE